jgi:hypothetical protein
MFLDICPPVVVVIHYTSGTVVYLAAQYGREVF